MKRWLLPQAAAVLGFCLMSETPARANIVFTCDASITALAGVCNTLQTNIAGLYSNTFTDAVANIYITLGSTGLGQSLTELNGVSYTGASGYKAALTADATSATDAAAVASLPANTSSTVLNSNELLLTNANLRALTGLGLTPSFGVTSAGGTCSLTVSNCYDGVITISQSQETSGNLWFRTGGPQGSNQYDFYSVVEHEVDEVLGTGSGAFGGVYQANTAFAPVDLFRVNSQGALAFNNYAGGNNSSCSDPSQTQNACFSLNTAIHYNNVAGSGDAGDFASNCSYVQDAAGCLGGATGFHDINSSAEIAILDAVGYSLATTAAPEPGTISLLGAGLALLGGLSHRRRKRRQTPAV